MSQTYEVGVRLNADGSGLVTQTKASADALDRVASSADRTTKSLGQTFAAAQKHTEVTADETKAISKLDAELEALLGRLDPTQRSINQMNNAQGLLTRSLQQGLLSQQQYNVAMAQARSMYGDAANDSERMAAGADRSAFATAGARRELIVLGHEAVTGNFSRMPGSFMVLAERVGASGAAILGVVAPIAAVAAVGLTMAAAFTAGHKEMESMNNALAITNDFSGLTRGGMRDLAREISSTGTITMGTAKDLVTTLVSSGQIGAQSISAVAKLSANYAAATGQDVAKLGPELVKLFEDPAKGAAVLNQQMHMLSAADIERIDHLTRMGQVTEAQLLLAQKVSEFQPKLEQNLGTVQKAWNLVKGAASDAWDAMLGVGREQTLEEKLREAKGNLAALANGNQQPAVPYMAPGRAAGIRSGQAQQAQASVDLATAAVYSQAEAAAQQGAKAEQNTLDNQAAALVRQTSEYQKIAELKDRIKLAGQFDAKTDEDKANKARTIRDLTEQIEAVWISAGAKDRALAVERINYTLKSREIAIAMAAEQNDAALKLGEIDQTEYDRRKTFLDLQKNSVQQVATQELVNAGRMAEADRLRLANSGKLLESEAQLIQMKGDNKEREDALAAYKAQQAIVNDMIDGVNKLGDAEQKRLTAAIAAQRLHNDEIGKTKDQIDLVKQAEQDAATAKLQSEADAIAALLNQQGLDQNAIAIYTAQLVQLNAQIAARKELSGLMADASVRQQQADYTRAQSEEYKRLFNTVEQTGKTVFTHLLSDGKGAFESIGKALKASVIDLLYQLTVRPFIIQIGASFAQQLGISTTSGMLAGTGGAGGMGSAISLGSNFLPGGFSGLLGTAATPAAGDALIGGTAAAGTMIEGTGILGSMGSLGTALAAVPGWGWAALAAGTLLGGDALFGGGGGPKASDASLRRGANGMFGVEMNNVAGGDPDMTQVLAMNAALNDPTRFDPSKLAGLVDTQVGTGSPADTAALITQLTAALGPAAKATQDLTTATTSLTEAQVASQRQALQDQLDQLTMTSAQLLEKQRNALDESNRALFDQVQAASAAATASEAEAAAKAQAEQEAAARATQTASERQGLQDQLDQLTMTSTQLLEKQRNALDASNRALFDQVQAATAAAAAAQAEAAAKAQAEQEAAAAKVQADQQAAADAARIANERYSLETQLLQVQGNTAELRARELANLDASNRAIQEQIWATQDLTTAQQNQASAASALASAQDSVSSAQQALESAVSGLPAKLGIDALQKEQQSLAVSDYVSPLDRLAAAKSMLDQTYTSGLGGDLTAVQAFPQQLQTALSIARDTYASGPQFQEIFLDGNRKLNDLLQRQSQLQVDLLKDVPMTIQQASNDQIAVMRTELRALGDKFDAMTAQLRRLVA